MPARGLRQGLRLGLLLGLLEKAIAASHSARCHSEAPRLEAGRGPHGQEARRGVASLHRQTVKMCVFFFLLQVSSVGSDRQVPWV